MGQFNVLVYDYYLSLFRYYINKLDYFFYENDKNEYEIKDVLTLFYIIKNIENFDRQKRGY